MVCPPRPRRDDHPRRLTPREVAALGGEALGESEEPAKPRTRLPWGATRTDTTRPQRDEPLPHAGEPRFRRAHTPPA